MWLCLGNRPLQLQLHFAPRHSCSCASISTLNTLISPALPPSLQVFDVLPAWGELPPGESELVTFTFFGHANVVARVTARCHVQGGPTYPVVVTGEASCPSFQLDGVKIDWGLQVPQASPGTAPCLGMMATGFLPTSIPGSLPFSAPLLALGLRRQPWGAMSSIQAALEWPSPPWPLHGFATSLELCG